MSRVHRQAEREKNSRSTKKGSMHIERAQGFNGEDCKTGRRIGTGQKIVARLAHGFNAPMSHADYWKEPLQAVDRRFQQFVGDGGDRAGADEGDHGTRTLYPMEIPRRGNQTVNQFMEK